MSTVAFIAQAELTADSLTDDRLLEILSTNPEALLDLIYGPSRRIKNCAPPHDHDEDGGEPHHLPILQRSFGQFLDEGLAVLGMVGIPLGIRTAAGSFEPTTTDGVTEYSNAKRLDCAMIVIPGGVSKLKVSLTEYHETTAKNVTLHIALRSLSSVNFQLGVASEEVLTALSFTTSGSPGTANQSVTIDDLTTLGDPTLDRELEASLWLAFDLDGVTEHRLLDWEIVAIAHTTQARPPSPRDLIFPPVAVKEIKAGSCVLSTQTGIKLKERYNGLNRGLWGSTPGLLNSLQPDRRRTYRESIAGIHQHRGSMCPTVGLDIIGDGAVLRDTQSFAFLGPGGLGTGIITSPGVPPELTGTPNSGALLHQVADLSSFWAYFRFRRSIPAGAGELRLRIGANADPDSSGATYNTSQKLLVSIDVVPVGGGSSIVTRLFCGPYVSPLDAAEDDFGYVEVEPEDNVAFLPNFDVAIQNKKGWNHGVQISESESEALRLISLPYRVSQEIRVQLTYPPARSSETYHATGDYEVRLRFQMRNADGDCDSLASLLWLCCYNAPGY